MFIFLDEIDLTFSFFFSSRSRPWLLLPVDDVARRPISGASRLYSDASLDGTPNRTRGWSSFVSFYRLARVKLPTAATNADSNSRQQRFTMAATSAAASDASREHSLAYEDAN